jgi:hypothetical protein
MVSIFGSFFVAKYGAGYGTLQPVTLRRSGASGVFAETRQAGAEELTSSNFPPCDRPVPSQG